MAQLKGGNRLDAALAEISKKVHRAAAVDVGFLEGATYPDGTSVPEVAAFNEFGVPSHGQPPRPYFRNMIAENSPSWPKAIALNLVANNYDAAKALDLVGEGIVGQLKQSIADLRDPPLAESTIKAKGFDKPLIDSSHMINSADHRVR